MRKVRVNKLKLDFAVSVLLVHSVYGSVEAAIEH